MHHIVHVLSICPHDTDTNRQLICAQHLLSKAPSLLTSKDQDQNTPGDCLNSAMTRKGYNKDVLKKFAQLFDQYTTEVKIKNKVRE